MKATIDILSRLTFIFKRWYRNFSCSCCIPADLCRAEFKSLSIIWNSRSLWCHRHLRPGCESRYLCIFLYFISKDLKLHLLGSYLKAHCPVQCHLIHKDLIRLFHFQLFISSLRNKGKFVMWTDHKMKRLKYIISLQIFNFLGNTKNQEFPLDYTITCWVSVSDNLFLRRRNY